MTQASNKNTKRHRARVWSLNSTYSACTLHEVADMLGLTRERVRQIEIKALHQLRKKFISGGYKATDFM